MINIQITKDDFENFCNICGLYRKDFLDTLDASELDHQQGRTTERDSLMLTPNKEIISGSDGREEVMDARSSLREIPVVYSIASGYSQEVIYSLS